MSPFPPQEKSPRVTQNKNKHIRACCRPPEVTKKTSCIINGILHLPKPYNILIIYFHYIRLSN